MYRFIDAIEKMLLGEEIAEEEYSTIKKTFASIINNSGHRGKVNIEDVTNECLLRLKEKADSYKYENNIYSRNKYILLYLLYSLNEVVSTTRYGIDIPERILQSQDIDNSKFRISIEQIQELEDPHNYIEEINKDVEIEFIINLLISDINEKEKDIIFKYYFHNKTQQEIADEYNISQQRIAAIINDVKNRLHTNCREQLDDY